MSNLVTVVFNPYGLAYLLIVVGSQIAYRHRRKKQRDRIATQRRTRGLPPTMLLHRTEHLSQKQSAALSETVLLLVSLLISPLLLMGIARLVERNSPSVTADQSALALIVLTVVALAFVSGRSVIQAVVGGLAFKLTTAFTVPFHLGDRIILHHRDSTLPNPGNLQGKVVQLSSFYITLETLSGQRVNVPTHTLWHQAISVINTASLCDIRFYLSPHVTSEQHRRAENLLLETVKSSVYLEPSKPVEIYTQQSLQAIELTAAAYVAASENAAAFKSDVTRQFLAFARQKQIPLASSQYLL